MDERRKFSVPQPSHRRREILAFNFDPLGYAHTSWWSAVAPGVPASLLADCKAPWRRRRLNARALELMGVGNYWEVDFLPPHRAVLLAEPRDVQQIALAMGVAMFREHLRKKVMSAETLDIRGNLGAVLYLGALSYKELAAAHDEDDAADALTIRRIASAGANVLFGACAESNPALVRRVRLKLPRSVVSDPVPACTTRVRQAAQRFIEYLNWASR